MAACAANFVEDGPSIQDLEVVLRWRFGQPFSYVLVYSNDSLQMSHLGAKLTFSATSTSPRRSQASLSSPPTQKAVERPDENRIQNEASSLLVPRNRMTKSRIVVTRNMARFVTNRSHTPIPVLIEDRGNYAER
jgi:hypothetical protein